MLLYNISYRKNNIDVQCRIVICCTAASAPREKARVSFSELLVSPGIDNWVDPEVDVTDDESDVVQDMAPERRRWCHQGNRNNYWDVEYEENANNHGHHFGDE